MDDLERKQLASDIEDLKGLVEELVRANEYLMETVFSQQRVLAGLVTGMKHFPALQSAFSRGLEEADTAAEKLRKAADEMKGDSSIAVGDIGIKSDLEFIASTGAKVFG